MSEKIKGLDNGQIRFSFDNGVEISIVWAPCSYSDNYNTHFDFTGKQMLESSTVEIMVISGASTDEIMGDGKEDSVRGYVPVSELFTILQRCKNYVPGKVML